MSLNFIPALDVPPKEYCPSPAILKLYALALLYKPSLRVARPDPPLIAVTVTFDALAESAKVGVVRFGAEALKLCNEIIVALVVTVARRLVDNSAVILFIIEMSEYHRSHILTMA